MPHLYDMGSYGIFIMGMLGIDYYEIKIHVSQQRFSNMASDWLAAVLPADQKP